MIRVAFETLLLFLLPFGLYALALVIARRLGIALPHMTAGLMGLSAAGLGLVALFFIGLGLLSAQRQGAYIPAHVENGRLIQGDIQ